MEAIPGRPRLRMARTIASQLPGMSMASRPGTTAASMSRIRQAVAVSA